MSGIANDGAGSVVGRGTMDARQVTSGPQGTLTRRQALHGAGVAAGGLLLANVLAACGGSDSTGTTAAITVPETNVGTVNMLGWQGYDDEVARKPFEARGGTLKTTYIGNNDEILTKLRGGGAGVYDVVTPNAAFLPAMVEAGVIEPLDYEKLPNTKGYFENFYKPDFNTFDGATWGAPVAWGDGPMVYRPDLVSNVPKSWLDLAKPEYKDEVAMWDDGFGHIVVMAKTLGFDPPNQLTADQLEQVTAELKKIRANARVVAPSLGDLADILARGDASLTTQSWEGVAMFVRDKGKPAEWSVPSEGTWGWCDHYCIAKDAPNPEGAYAFIDTMLSPKASATIASTVVSGTPIEDAVPLLTKQSSQLFDYDDVSGALEDLGFYSLPPLAPDGDITTMDDWNAAWAEVKG